MVTYPSDWDVVELGSKCNITSSKRVFEREWEKSGIPFFRTRDIASFHFGEKQKDKLYISEETYQDKIASSGEPHKGDLLVTGVGTIGLPYLIDSDNPIYFKDGNILWIKKSEAFFPQWLYLQFLSKEIQGQIQDNSGFTTVGTFTIKNAKKLNVPMPSIKEQTVVAETLYTFDTYIDDLAELIEKKRAIRDGALEELTTGTFTIDGQNLKWNEVELNVIAFYKKGRTSSAKNRYVSTENMNQNFTGIVHYKGSDIIAGCQFNETDILMANIRPYLKKIWFADFSGCCSADVLVIKAKAGIDPRLLYYLLANDRFVNYVMSGGTKGIKMPRGDKEFIMHYPVLFPSDKLKQTIIADSVAAMDEEIKALEIERDKMIQIREGAMDDLLTGRVRLRV